MAKLIHCKTCNAQITSMARKCPSCGAKNRKPIYKRVWVYFVVAFIILVIIIGSSGQKNNSGNNATPEPKNVFGVGEIADVNNIFVKLKKVEESMGNGFNRPDDGKIFLLCSFEIENKSNKEINISSLLSFKAYVDDYSTNLSLAAQIVSEEEQLDGAIAPGKKMAGAIGYEVPKDWKKFEITLTPDYWSKKDVKFVIEND